MIENCHVVQLSHKCTSIWWKRWHLPYPFYVFITTKCSAFSLFFRGIGRQVVRLSLDGDQRSIYTLAAHFSN